MVIAYYCKHFADMTKITRSVYRQMMMTMMRGFVERVINSPQTRCRANVRGERVAVRRAAGKLFQMTGPATEKLLIPSVVVVLGTDNAPV